MVHKVLSLCSGICYRAKNEPFIGFSHQQQFILTTPRKQE
jgi:hypothetical protein